MVTRTDRRSGPPAAGSSIKNTLKDLSRYGPTTFFTSGILSIPVILSAVFRATLPGRAGTTTQFLFQAISYVTVGLWLTVAIAMATLDYATGKDPGVGGLLKKSFDFPRISSYFLASLLFGLLLVGVVVAALVPFLGSIISSLAGSGWNFERLNFRAAGPIVAITGVLSFIAAVVVFLFVFLRFGAFGPANILEKRGPVEALRRSREITAGHRLDFFVLWIYIALIGIAAFLLLGGPVTIASGMGTQTQQGLSFFDPYAGLGRAQILIAGVSSYLFEALWRPFVVAAITNFFLDLRGRPSAPVIADPSLDGVHGGKSLSRTQGHPDAGEQQ